MITSSIIASQLAWTESSLYSSWINF